MTDLTTVYDMLGQIGDVTIEELASLSRMSKTRVRNALKQLETAGFISITPEEQE